MKYPKIETLYDRDENFNVDSARLRLPEFVLINRWVVTEKVDGTNIRIFLTLDGTVEIRGRTDKAQIPVFLFSYLRETFTQNAVRDALVPDGEIQTHEYILYGEGYGNKIQKAGKQYRPDDVSFRLFDVKVGGLWLDWENVENIAWKLGICTVPVLGFIYHLPKSKDELLAIIDESVVAMEDSENILLPEGIVARTDPLLLTRRGERLMWKLKFSDFA